MHVHVRVRAGRQASSQIGAAVSERWGGGCRTSEAENTHIIWAMCQGPMLANKQEAWSVKWRWLHQKEGSGGEGGGERVCACS